MTSLHPQMTPMLIRAYLADFNGNHSAAAEYAHVALAVIRYALRGEFLHDEVKLHLWSAARKRLGAAKVEEILGVASSVHPVVSPIAMPLPASALAALEDVEIEVVGDSQNIARQAPTVIQECLHCHETHPFTEEFFSVFRRKPPLLLRRACHRCWHEVALKNGALGGRGYRGERHYGKDNMGSIAEELMALAARAEQLEQAGSLVDEQAQELAALKEENAALKAQVEQFNAFRNGLAAMLQPAAAKP